jgi:hypothetical protein
MSEMEFSAKVTLCLYPESVSGRSEVVYSPARPNHRVEGFEDFFISQLDFIDALCIKPGDSVTANAHGIIANEMLNSLRMGSKWLVYAGPARLIGEIINVEWLVPH